MGNLDLSRIFEVVSATAESPEQSITLGAAFVMAAVVLFILRKTGEGAAWGGIKTCQGAWWATRKSGWAAKHFALGTLCLVRTSPPEPVPESDVAKQLREELEVGAVIWEAKTNTLATEHLMMRVYPNDPANRPLQDVRTVKDGKEVLDLTAEEKELLRSLAMNAVERIEATEKAERRVRLLSKMGG